MNLDRSTEPEARKRFAALGLSPGQVDSCIEAALDGRAASTEEMHILLHLVGEGHRDVTLQEVRSILAEFESAGIIERKERVVRP